jgi:hypothetical protein
MSQKSIGRMPRLCASVRAGPLLSYPSLAGSNAS